jgi:uncharacterized protein YndB with AHSA1/START domain
MAESTTDRIEKRIVLRAPRARVWRALAEAEEFGAWFRADMKGQSFVPGQWARGRVTHPGYEHLVMEILVERVEPERLLSWRWHPYPLEPGQDPARSPMTLVTFELADVPEGTLLTVVESGFDRVPPERRAAAFRENEQGWTEQMANIERHVSRAD